MSDGTGLWCPGECGQELRIVSRWSDKGGTPHAIATCPCGDGYAREGDLPGVVPSRRDLDELVLSLDMRGVISAEAMLNWLPYLDPAELRGLFEQTDPYTARRALERRRGAWVPA